MRAMFMQNKYGKADTSDCENKPQKTEDDHVPSPSQTSAMLSASRAHQLPPLEKDGATKASISTAKTHPNESENLVIARPNTTSQEQLPEKLKCSQIQWQTPPGTFVLCLFICFCSSLLNCFYLGGNVVLLLIFNQVLHYCGQRDYLIKSDGLVRIS